jgi:hypothetical protein
MTPFDEGDEPQNASDAGLFSKYIPHRRFQSCLYMFGHPGSCSVTYFRHLRQHPLQDVLGHMFLCVCF